MDGILGSFIDSVINFHYRSLVTASVAIVWGREYSDNASIMLPLIAFHNQLVRPSNKVQAIDVSKLLGDVLTKSVSGSPR